MKRVLANARIGVIRAYRRARNGHAKSRIIRVIIVGDRSGLPERLDPRCVYVLGATTHKWALLDCPCGRGHTIELNLANPARTRWKVTINNAGQPSVHPSIDYRGQPRCHYWLRDGRIRWAPNGRSAAEPQR
ncbi:MAG: DUF6527 family protein [Nocardioides sp.]|uniref:DUF6527 family protein n=1 Tax=Nocardioides sp. TaxID=35761 RepID=UPI0039E71F38